MSALLLKPLKTAQTDPVKIQSINFNIYNGVVNSIKNLFIEGINGLFFLQTIIISFAKRIIGITGTGWY